MVIFLLLYNVLKVIIFDDNPSKPVFYSAIMSVTVNHLHSGTKVGTLRSPYLMLSFTLQYSGKVNHSFSFYSSAITIKINHLF